MPMWLGADHPPEDDAMPEDWRCCPQHDIWHSPDNDCPACDSEIEREIARLEGAAEDGQSRWAQTGATRRGR